ncbi:MAG: hypothetical protein OPY07_05060 [Nitrosopumilus sp.]|nr:hypothetical protein [Nitrosopumilus sp.]
MSEKWLDLNIDGRRLNRIVRLLETYLKKEEDADKMIRFANSITYVTGKKAEMAFIGYLIELLCNYYLSSYILCLSIDRTRKIRPQI